MLALQAAISGLLCYTIVHFHPFRGDIALLAETSIMLAFYLALSSGTLALPPGTSLLALLCQCVSAQLGTMVLATAAYRLSPWHPLAKYPGPVLYKLSSMRYAYLVASGWRHRVMQALHQQYGDVVRVGPDALSINTRDAVGPIYASAQCCDRSQAYALRALPGDGLFFMLGRDEHNPRRNHWAPAFANTNLTFYQAIMDRRTVELTDCMMSRARGGLVNIAECIEHWSYDFMGDFAFGPASELVRTHEGRDASGLVPNGKYATVMFDILGEVPWLMDILWYLPNTRSIRSLHSLARRLMHLREQGGSDHGKDISTYLLDTSRGNRALTPDEKTMDALFAIQAGSDTTANVLQYTFFFLISHPATFAKLREELDGAFPCPDDRLDFNTLAELPYLNGVINEGLRLGTPLSGLQRVTPPNGMVIGNDVIPGNTVVSVPNYTQQLDGRNFWPHPETFIPERWLPGGLGPGSRVEPNAIMSFSFGPFGCLGRTLAMLELRIVVARVVLRFDMSFPKGFNPDTYMKSIRNIRTTLFPSPLTAQIVPRYVGDVGN